MHGNSTRASVYIERPRGDQKKHARDRSLMHAQDGHKHRLTINIMVTHDGYIHLLVK